jgi:hypothetical protein
VRALAKARRAGGGSGPREHLTAEVTLSPAAPRAGLRLPVYFDLVNLAEEAHRIPRLRERAREQHPAPIAESIADAVGR